MPTLLPRESMAANSVVSASIQRPSPSDHRVGFSNSFTRLIMGSLAFRPALLLFGNSRARVTTAPLPHTTGAYGQFPRRDFNPLDSSLLLRTVRSCLLPPNPPHERRPYGQEARPDPSHGAGRRAGAGNAVPFLQQPGRPAQDGGAHDQHVSRGGNARSVCGCTEWPRRWRTASSTATRSAWTWPSRR